MKFFVSFLTIRCTLLFRKPMSWKEDHDKALIREILVYEPWIQRKGSQERGQIWRNIAESLNQISDLNFRVDERAVRDHHKHLNKKYKKEISEENRASGIAPPEETELIRGLREISEQFHDFDLKHEENKQQKQQSANKEVQIAEDFRLASLETYGETSQRKTDDDEIPPKKKRRTGSETISYLRDKNAQEVDMKKQELDILETRSNKELEIKREEINVRKLEVEERKQQITKYNCCFFNSKNKQTEF